MPPPGPQDGHASKASCDIGGSSKKLSTNRGVDNRGTSARAGLQAKLKARQDAAALATSSEKELKRKRSSGESLAKGDVNEVAAEKRAKKNKKKKDRQKEKKAEKNPRAAVSTCTT